MRGVAPQAATAGAAVALAELIEESLPPMKILILGGAGFTGRIVARHLLERSSVSVALATRRLEKAQRFVNRLNSLHGDQRAEAVAVDAADVESLRKAFAGCGLVVVAAPVVAHLDKVFRAAIEAGVDCFDLQISAAKLALLRSLEGEIVRRGRCFITEAGFHPGLPSALARAAAARLDSVEEIVTAGYLNMGDDLPYSEAFDELIEALKDYHGETFADGAWTKPGSLTTRVVDFGGDIGKRRCYSMAFEELRPLPAMFPSLRNLGFYIAETHWITDRLVFPIVWIAARLGVGSVRRLGRFLWRGMRTFHRPPYRVELVAQASGRRAGKAAEVAIRVSHPDGYALTAIPVAAAILQYLDAPAAKPGVWTMGCYVEPSRLLGDMADMGVEVAIAD